MTWRMVLAGAVAMTAWGQVWQAPAASALEARTNLVYGTNEGTELKFDLYRPAGAGRTALPVAIFFNGTGSTEQRTWPIYQAWAKSVTAAGLAGAAYDSKGTLPERDFDAFLGYLKEHAAELGIEPNRVLLFAASANVTAGLPVAMDPKRTDIRAAVIYYGAGETAGFRPGVPVLLVRSGLDGSGLNHKIDGMIGRAMAGNAPLEVINFPSGHHAFDLRDDNPLSREIVARTLAFMKTQMTPAVQQATTAGVAEARAVSYVYAADWTRAAAAYQELAAARPEDSEVQRNLGNVLLAQQEYRKALGAYEKSLALGNWNRGWISYSAAVASLKLGDTRAAMEWVEKLRDIEPMRKQLKGDPEMAPLRENARFREIAGMN